MTRLYRSLPSRRTTPPCCIPPPPRTGHLSGTSASALAALALTGARSNQLSLYALGVMWVCFQDFFRRFHDKIPEKESRDMMRVQCRDVFTVRGTDAPRLWLRTPLAEQNLMVQ
jgi:hypothetical protein